MGGRLRKTQRRKIAANQRWRLQNARAVKSHKLKARYGITIDQFEAMVIAQGNRCAICKSPPKTVLYVDHCHKTGKVRGLLCRACNLALRQADDCPEWPENARRYLDV